MSYFEMEEDSETPFLSKEKKDTKSETTPFYSDKKKIPYPYSVFCILSTEACERFSYYGMKTVLTLYLRLLLSQHSMSHSPEDSVDSVAKIIYHAFNFLSYFTALIGAFLADSFWGKYKTIFYISIVYAIGQSVLTLASVPIESGEALQKIPRELLSYFGLVLIAVGTGGIKPCVVSFGADQFKIPEQQKQLDTFFDVFYASINIGALVSTFSTPLLRNTPCLNASNCFPLAFGVPAILMFIAVLSFVSGSSLYKKPIPERNVVFDFFHCIWTALFASKKSNPAAMERENDSSHWLNRASVNPKFDALFIKDVKAVLNISVLMIPFPIFWSLFDQQGSQWVLLASKMNGKITDKFTILPDQMGITNSLFVLLLIPIYNRVIYPVFDDLRIFRNPLSRIICGGVLLGVAFIIAGVVEIVIENSEVLSVHMLWLLPQCLILTCGEIMFNITSLQFAFMEAPDQMKSVVQALYLLTTAFGNLLDMFLIGLFDAWFSRAVESFVFSGMLFVDMFILYKLSQRYKSNQSIKD